MLCHRMMTGLPTILAGISTRRTCSLGASSLQSSPRPNPPWLQGGERPRRSELRAWRGESAHRLPMHAADPGRPFRPQRADDRCPIDFAGFFICPSMQCQQLCRAFSQIFHWRSAGVRSLPYRRTPGRPKLTTSTCRAASGRQPVALRSRKPVGHLGIRRNLPVRPSIACEAQPKSTATATTG